MGLQYPLIIHSLLWTIVYLEKYTNPQNVQTSSNFFYCFFNLQYRLSIKSNSQCPSKIRLILKRNKFGLGFPDHSFTITANGYTVKRVFWSDMDYYFQFYQAELLYYFIGSDILIEIDVPQGFFFFNISYFINDSGNVEYLQNSNKNIHSNTYIRFRMLIFQLYECLQ